VHPTPVTHKLCVTVRVLIVRMGSTWYCNDRMQRIAQTFSHHAHESLWHLALACSRYTAYRPPTATRRRESNQQFGHVETRVPKGTVGVAGCRAFIHSLKRLQRPHDKLLITKINAPNRHFFLTLSHEFVCMTQYLHANLCACGGSINSVVKLRSKVRHPTLHLRWNVHGTQLFSHVRFHQIMCCVPALFFVARHGGPHAFAPALIIQHHIKKQVSLSTAAPCSHTKQNPSFFLSFHGKLYKPCSSVNSVLPCNHAKPLVSLQLTLQGI
jgi:hypothetical protein